VRNNHCNRFSAKTTCRKCNIAFFKFDEKMASGSDSLTFLAFHLFQIKSEWYPDKPELPFAMATPHHFLIKLYWKIKQLRLSLEAERNLSSMRAPAHHALNCAVTGWHLSDWV